MIVIFIIILFLFLIYLVYKKIEKFEDVQINNDFYIPNDVAINQLSERKINASNICRTFIPLLVFCNITSKLSESILFELGKKSGTNSFFPQFHITNL